MMEMESVGGGGPSGSTNGSSTVSITKKRKSCGRKVAKRLHSCPTCNKSFPHPSWLLIHQRVHTGSKPFHCDLCPKKFSQKSNLTVHRRLTHFPEQVQKLPCPECGKTFSRKGNLVQHQQLVHGQRQPYACVFCAKKFKKRSTLRLHIIGHVQEKPYFCKDCDQSYTRNETLKIHRSGHTGDKYFKCPHLNCTVAFFYRPLLIAHRRQFHKEDVGVSYTCVFCNDGFEFVRKHQLQKHLLGNHLCEKPHFCKKCDKCYVKASDLTEHSNMKHHGGVKRFRCYHCFMMFYSNGQMWRHMRRNHRVGEN